MAVLEVLKKTINQVGIKEVARRAGLSASTVSRINSGQLNPSLYVTEKISNVLGYSLELHSNRKIESAPRLNFTKSLLVLLRKELRSLGVFHTVIFGSVARKEDGPNSDIDIYLDFGKKRPHVSKMLRAEGRILETFGDIKVDIVSDLSSIKGQRLKKQIEMDGINAF